MQQSYVDATGEKPAEGADSKAGGQERQTPEEPFVVRDGDDDSEEYSMSEGEVEDELPKLPQPLDDFPREALKRKLPEQQAPSWGLQEVCGGARRDHHEVIAQDLRVVVAQAVVGAGMEADAAEDPQKDMVDLASEPSRHVAVS